MRTRILLLFTILFLALPLLANRYPNVGGGGGGGGSDGLGSDGDKGDITVGGGGTTLAIDAGAVDTDEIATDGVGAAELNATGVEAELEAVLDLNELQGSVTDGQVPSTLTLDLEASTLSNIADDEVLVGSGVGTATYLALPGTDCNTSTEKLHYNSTTRTFSCQADAGGGAVTSLDSGQTGTTHDLKVSNANGIVYYYVDADGDDVMDPLEPRMASLNDLLTGTGYEGFAIHAADVCGDDASAACTGGNAPDGDFDDADFQRIVYDALSVKNQSVGESGGEIILPAGTIELSSTIQIGDGDDIVNNYGYTGNFLDASEASSQLDGRVLHLKITGQGANRTAADSQDMHAGTTLVWAGSTQDPMILIAGGSHVTIEGVAMRAWDGTNTRSDYCIKVNTDTHFGVAEGNRLINVACNGANTAAIELDDGDTQEELFQSYTLATALTGVTTSVVVNETIDLDIPTGAAECALHGCDITITLDDSSTKRVSYTSYSGSTFTIPSTDFTDPEDATGSNAITHIHNGKSESMHFSDVWIRGSPICYRHNSNNTQGFSFENLHCQNFGNHAISDGCTDTTPSDGICDDDLGHGVDTTPVERFATTDIDSCGGGSSETGGPASVTACGIDVRQGDVHIKDSILAAGGKDVATDVGVHLSNNHADQIFDNLRIEANSISAGITTRDGAESGNGQILHLRDYNFFSSAGSGTQEVLQLGSNSNLIVDGMEGTNTAGGGLSVTIDTLGSNETETMISVRGVRLNTISGDAVGTGGGGSFTVDGDAEGNIFGEYTYAIQCDDVNNNVTGAPQTSGVADGICDFDGVTPYQIPRTYVLGPKHYGNTDPADSGVIRLENNAAISWENSPTGSDITLACTASETCTIDTLEILHEESLDSTAELDVLIGSVDTGSGNLVRAVGPSITGGLTLSGGLTMAAVAEPTEGMRDADMVTASDPEDNVIRLADCPTGTNAGNNQDCDFLVAVQSGGAFKGMLMVDTTDAGATTLHLGSTSDVDATDGLTPPTNAVVISETGVISFAGSGGFAANAIVDADVSDTLTASAYTGTQHYDFVWKDLVVNDEAMVKVSNGAITLTEFVCLSTGTTDPSAVTFTVYECTSTGGTCTTTGGTQTLSGTNPVQGTADTVFDGAAGAAVDDDDWILVSPNAVTTAPSFAHCRLEYTQP